MYFVSVFRPVQLIIQVDYIGGVFSAFLLFCTDDKALFTFQSADILKNQTTVRRIAADKTSVSENYFNVSADFLDGEHIGIVESEQITDL